MSQLPKNGEEMSIIATDKERELNDDALKDEARVYIFEVKDGWGETIFKAEKPTIEMLEEEIGEYERLKKEKKI